MKKFVIILIIILVILSCFTYWYLNNKARINNARVANMKYENYLNEEEMKGLDRLTISFLDYAEDMAYEHKVMTMKDWIEVTDDLLKFRKKQVLVDSGRISHKQAISKANEEYEKYRIKQDQEYVSSMDELYKKYLEEK